MSDPFSEAEVEDAANAVLEHIPDADDRRTLLRILCGAEFKPLRARVEPAFDWEAQPPWALYAGMDADGGWWVYSVDIEPDEFDAAWTATDADGIEVERMTDPPVDWIGDWRETRRIRPCAPGYMREAREQCALLNECVHPMTDDERTNP